MAFRNKQKADQVRIDALEDELDEKDAEIARLEEKLAERDRPKKKKKKKKKRAASVPQESDLPEGDVWDVETTLSDGTWMLGLLFVAVGLGGAGYMGVQQGFAPATVLPFAVFILPAAMLLHRRGLTLDRAKGRITRWDWLLFRVRRTYRVEGAELELLTRNMTPKNGKPWTAGELWLRTPEGDRELFLMKIGKGRSLARRAAAFLDLGLTERRETPKEIMARAQAPLKFVTIFLILGAIIAAVVTLM